MTDSLAAEAVALSEFGFYLFPISTGKKSPPAINGWQDLATQDPKILQHWFGLLNYNIGITTSKFGDGEALLAIDVDNKKGKSGDEELLRLELEGWELPRTFRQTTPSGGQHLIFRVPAPVRQGVNVLGSALDIRSAGGYLVGTGSITDRGVYRADYAPVAPAPQWLIDRCGAARTGPAEATIVLPGINPEQAMNRVIHYLSVDAPLAVEGLGGDTVTYKVAAQCKDFGVTEGVAFGLMDTYWNIRCSPPWDADELQDKIRHAYKYGLAPVGSAAPEVEFKPIESPESHANGAEVNGSDVQHLHPFKMLNKEYAFVLAGGGAHILWETKDALGRYRLEHLNISAFHSKFAPQKMQIGRTEHPISELWLESKQRREYDGLVFLPEQKTPDRFYNLWRGFAYAPGPTAEHPSVDMFLDHAKANVCGNDEALFRWLMGYFAHLLQRPWEKPLVALVFRGAKGTGKNALIERVGALLGGHFLLTSNRRYLLGNFNGHLENCLLFALDEAFWSGDKQAEGALKDLITGREHVIEHKGKEPYTVANKTRVVIIGNEDWLVPASHDERRFAVFNVGDGRKQDRRFFTDMRVGMEGGGYAALLRYFLDYDLSHADVNAAPHTEALHDQKHATLDPFHQWWKECLDEGRILGTEQGGWPDEIHCERFRSAFRRYVKDRNIKSRVPEDKSLGRLLKLCAPTLGKRRMGVQEDGSQPYAYLLRPLDEHRAEWDTFIGFKTTWG